MVARMALALKQTLYLSVNPSGSSSVGRVSLPKLNVAGSNTPSPAPLLNWRPSGGRLVHRRH